MILATSLFLLNAFQRFAAADSCKESFTRCSPDGASASEVPPIGEGLSSLYVDLLDSINKVQNTKRELSHEEFMLSIRAAGSICCIVFFESNLPDAG